MLSLTLAATCLLALVATRMIGCTKPDPARIPVLARNPDKHDK